MAEILPTPRAGSWLFVPNIELPATSQPRAGSWLFVPRYMPRRSRAYLGLVVHTGP